MYRLRVFVVLSAALMSMTIGCKVTVPNATTVEGLGSLEPGMAKSEVLLTLKGVYPHDIYNGEGVGCEVHEYRYKHPYQVVERADRQLRNGLRGNPRKFLRTGKAYAIYRDGALETVFTEKEKDYIPYLLASKKEIELRCDPPIPGCKDSESINFNPLATVDDGSCVFCPCGYLKNFAFKADRPISECNQPCIKDDSRCKTCPSGQRPNPDYDRYRPDSDCNKACIPCAGPCESMPDSILARTCGPCELIEAMSASEGASINLNIDMYDDGISNFKNQTAGDKSEPKRIKPRTSKTKASARSIRKKKATIKSDKPLTPDELRKIVDIYKE